MNKKTSSFRCFIRSNEWCKTLIFIILISSTASLAAQNYETKKSKPLFASHDVLGIRLIGDIGTIIRDVEEDSKEHPAVLEYVENGDTVKLDVQVETRGNFRRKRENCSFPPLRINLKKKQVKGTLFDGMDKLKLVTHCRPNSNMFEQYVVEEYLIYRTFNILTDTSFRAKFLNVSYVDNTNDKVTESIGFFIEPDDALEERLGMIEVKQKYILPDQTRFDYVSTLSVFEYMIGNTDWAISTLHNVVLFSADTLKPPYAVPYDFDWSGLLNTVYAKPLPRYETESVTERVFKGYCRTMEQLKTSFEIFNEKKDEIYHLYENFEMLKSSEKKRILKYLDEFYEVIADDKKITTEFMENCLK
jgi:hypothetical protein